MDQFNIQTLPHQRIPAPERNTENPEHNKAGLNIRDIASINELMVLSNIESMNAEMMRSGIDKKARFDKVQEIARRQLATLNAKDSLKSIKKTSDEIYLIEAKKSG